MKFGGPIVIFGDISFPTPFTPGDPCARFLKVSVMVFFEALYPLGSFSEFLVIVVFYSVFRPPLSLWGRCGKRFWKVCGSLFVLSTTLGVPTSTASLPNFPPIRPSIFPILHES